MHLPTDHPLRRELHAEVHARPPEVLATPVRVIYLALLSSADTIAEHWRQVRDLTGRFGVDVPERPLRHFSADLGPFRLKWERHTEFVRYKFIVPIESPADASFEMPALDRDTQAWIERLPGELIGAVQLLVLPDTEDARDFAAISKRHFADNVLVGAEIAGGAASAYTDLQLHEGFTRFLVYDREMTSRQTGRTVQRLVEIESYRMMALLALPIAQQLGPLLAAAEGELARITAALADARDADEPRLLDRLTQLEAQVESYAATHSYRFGAAFAYDELVRRRIDELRESRLPGLQTFREFTERRLAPAINTCRSTAARLDSVSERIARATQLLSTRVEVTREKQNRSLLESMNRRAAMQLRLQQTVEGLSVVAITYYIVGLVGYAAKGAVSAGIPLDPDVAMGVSIPLVLLGAALALRRVRRTIHRGDPA
jgi:uncharacterized membrane-anchored protein